MTSISARALAITITIILATHFLYYPKWSMERSEATISWDVSGYYMYLPATFIYKDLNKCAFIQPLIDKYHFTPEIQQAFIHENSGSCVMKYSVGQAIQYLPFFQIAHLWATIDTRYEADGFSLPYQLMISLGSLIVAIIGLLFLRKSLNYIFNDKVTAIVIICCVLGSNYFNYSALDGAMTHNVLFAIYALTIYCTIKFYEQPTYKYALFIGLLIGYAALTRPSDIVLSLFVLLWGLNITHRKSRSTRLNFIKEHCLKYVLAIFIMGSVGFIQLVYWKTTTDEWLVYSYQEQGFSWLSPHIYQGLFSYKSGWLTYTPIMIFSIIGLGILFRREKSQFYPIVIFFLTYLYITFAWDIWWYGGSLGQRAMIQSYPILAIPMGHFIQSTIDKNIAIRSVFSFITLLFVYYNFWLTHQAHRGGILHAGQMTKAYFWKTLGNIKLDTGDLKLLDTDEVYQSKNLHAQKEVYLHTGSFDHLSKEKQFSTIITLPNVINKEWLRVSFEATIGAKEWNIWKMTQVVVKIKNQNIEIKKKFIRLQRHLNDGDTKHLHFDVSIPQAHYTHIEAYFWNAESDKEIEIKNVEIVGFNEK